MYTIYYILLYPNFLYALYFHGGYYYASRRSRTRDTVKLTVCLCVCVCVCVCVSVPTVTAQRLQCDEK